MYDFRHTKKAVLITDANENIGLGHLTRSIVLYKVINSYLDRVYFSVKSNKAKEILSNMGLGDNVVDSYNNCDLLVVDLKDGINANVIRKEKENGKKILLIDEKSDARLYADFVCDSMMTDAIKRKYKHSNNVRYLYGLKYAIIDERFRKLLPTISHNKKSILIYLSMRNAGNVIYNLLQALYKYGFKGYINIIINKEEYLYGEINRFIKLNWPKSNIFTFTTNIYDIMKDSTIVITKLGIMMIEALSSGRICYNIEPTLAHYELHKQLSEFYSDWPVANAGMVGNVDYEKIAQSIVKLSNKNILKLSNAGTTLVDGLGARRVVYELFGGEVCD